MKAFVLELRRRNVIRVSGLYLASAWLLLQVAGTVLPLFHGPEWLGRGLFMVLAIGFVPIVVLAWVFQWTPRGLERDGDLPTGNATAAPVARRLDRIAILVLAVGLVYFAVDKFVLSPAREAAKLEVARQEGRTAAIVSAYGERSIAVLPFADLSRAKDQQYLSDGLAEELLNLLARIPQLRVISRSSAFAFQGQGVNIPEIAKKLDVAYVLDGSVRQAGNRIRVTVQLVDARSDTNLWSDAYDRPMDDIFAIQEEIAAGVVSQLRVKLLGEVPAPRATTAEAYALYLQAVAIPLQTEEAYRKAIDLLQQALAIDPAYVPAWDSLAITYGSAASFGLMSSEEGYRLSREAANKALAVDPDNSQAHAQLADIALRHDADMAGAARHLQAALANGSQDLNNLNIAEDLTKSLGRMADAVAINEYIVARDPMQSIAFSQAGIAYQQAGRLDDSIAASRRALDMEPGQPVTHFIVATSQLLKGEAADALAEIEKEPFEPFRLFGQAMAYHSLGRHRESDAVLADIVARYAQDAAYNIAYVEAWRGNADEAFAWLDKAVEYRDTGLPMLVVEPLFASLHGDPRWEPLLRKLGKAPEQLAAIGFEVAMPRAEPAPVDR